MNKEKYLKKKSAGLKMIKSENLQNLQLNDEQIIMNATMTEIDHIDRNRANNRKSNLRFCSDKENSINRSLRKDNISGVVGVRLLKNDKWAARITINNKEVHLGVFENFDDAVKTRLKAEEKYFKEFAPQKHLYNKYGVNQNKV